ncbi:MULTISPECIES: putative toxin-antitoxin system toxin component, PIN family [Pedobacter]|uniref:PilT protein domain protein n=1 Tax=Pedobacter heparinus (strain ATCC 13125 / DSM 2366 / CIP 104194 / JCM 7457 / NBRC 12017 / NCIMB 9290 / NRRL B-14731 / HIM 762-3) TaxID=485917 RepID=C6Y0X9_PEDHD|nr:MULTISPECIES: putative toxin-antitoxin system toxin component, PIN family [Pedobacter]ACU04906.1 PilT protein domain protein [Pedobacter heparinus DSM 2366]MBB5437878.1 putative PIN family toxin of toxin-antitoxin system [Pedobacter sp. AK017]
MLEARYFVFDTNALISAHLIPGSVSFKAFDLALKNGTIVSSVETWYEFSTRFIRPKFNSYLTIEKREFYILMLKNRTEFVDVKKQVTICKDPDDDKFLGLAVAADVACIVSGDKDLLILNPYENIPILTPVQFLTYFAELDDSFIVNEPNVYYGNMSNAAQF